MGRRSKIGGKTRSELIKEYLDRHPSAGPKTVVEALKKDGVEVSIGLVGQVKYMGKPTEPEPLTVDDILVLKNMARRLGGTDRLHEAVDRLQEVFDGQI